MKPIIKIRDVSYAYRGREDARVLDGISLEIDQGEFFAIAGRTGSGKSTLCYIINGLAPHSFGGRLEGKVEVDGLETRKATIPELSRKVGIVLQSAESQIVGLTVEEDVEFGLENLALPVAEIKERSQWALETVGMWDYRDSSPWKLSGGQKQRVAIAAALAFRPKILLLDNPTAELDPIGKEDVLSTIARLNDEYGITIVIIDQDLHEIIPYAHRLAILDGGKITLLGSPEDVLDQATLLREIGIKLPDVTEVGYQLRKRGRWTGRLPVTLESTQKQLTILLEHIKPRTIPPRESTPLGEPLIIGKDIEFSYPNGAPVLNGIDVTIRRGEFIALMGPNGAGKTTFAKLLNGLLKPTAGQLTVLGQNTTEHTMAEIASRVGYVFQNPDHQIFSKTVGEELAFGPKNLGWPEEKIRQSVTRALADIDMLEQRDAEPFFMGLAERKLIAIASILIMEPEVLVLDEPATGADYSIALRIMRYISDLHRQGLTVIVITHDVSLAANYANRLLVLREGKIVLDGPPADIFRQREQLYQCHVSPPQVTELANRLGHLGVPQDIIRVEDLVYTLTGD